MREFFVDKVSARTIAKKVKRWYNGIKELCSGEEMYNPLITMSAITGKPVKNDIYEYLKSLKDNGIEQAMLYPRSGCELEYLSEEWFKTIGDFINCAQELNMCLWLYDDFNWPSGDAGGRVTAKEEFRLKSIITKGDDIGKISCKSRHNAGLFGEKFFPDLLCFEAVDYFIETTHEEYYKRFGEYFGTVIKGMYTDEPSIGYCCQGNSIPYYDGMISDYQNEFGREFACDMHTNSQEFYSNCSQIISKRFKKAYVEKLVSWCHSHGILMTGHFMCDNDPDGAVVHSGDFLENLSSFSMPGIDEIFTDVKDKSIFSLLGSAEYASGKNGAMAELFALGPCSMAYSKKILMLYLCAAFKIDHYFLAVSPIDMRGNKKIIDYFNIFAKDQPDFSGMRLVAKETKKIIALAKKDFTPDVYVRFPYKECAKSITGSYNTAPYHFLLNELTYNQIQWKLINHENKKDAPTIEILANGEILLDSAPYDIAKIKRKKIVTDEKGDTPTGIFVRRYDDGTFVALNLFAPSGTYFVSGKPMYFGENAVVASGEYVEYQKEEINVGFGVVYHNKNVIRAMHQGTDKKATIECDKETELTLAIRNDANIYLNGEKKIGEHKADVLSIGMKNLYKITDTVWIKPKNEVEIENDYKYLPSLFLVGDFMCESKNEKLYLKKRPHEYQIGEKIYDFGTVEFFTKITVPQNAVALELSGTELLTEIYVDDNLIDKKICSPYMYNIGKEIWGKEIELKIIQQTSISPIFGNLNYWEENAENIGWRGTPVPSVCPLGFQALRWCYQ